MQNLTQEKTITIDNQLQAAIDLINQEYMTFSKASRLLEISEAHCRKLINNGEQGFNEWIDDPLLVISLAGSRLLVLRKAVIGAVEFRRNDPKYAPKDLRFWKDYAKNVRVSTSGLNKCEIIEKICKETEVEYSELIARLI